MSQYTRDRFRDRSTRTDWQSGARHRRKRPVSPGIGVVIAGLAGAALVTACGQPAQVSSRNAALPATRSAATAAPATRSAPATSTRPVAPLLGGEAIVVLNESLLEGMLYLRKQSLQLASKMRFLAAQFDALLTDELWLRNASHANEMASRLAGAVTGIDGVEITRPVQANALFVRLPRAATDALLKEFDFYVWDELTGEVRWMCCWDTTAEDIDTFAAAVSAAVYAAA